MIFSTQIFLSSKLSPDAATYGTIGIGLMNVFVTLLSILLMDVIGRRMLILISICGLAIDTIVFTVTYSQSVRSFVCQAYSIISFSGKSRVYEVFKYRSTCNFYNLFRWCSRKYTLGIHGRDFSTNWKSSCCFTSSC